MNPNPTPPPEEHQFKPGESGNPKGKPKGTRSLSTILKEMLDEDIEVIEGSSKTKKKFADVIVRQLMQKANKGDIKAIQEIWDRMEGKAKQTIDQSNTGDVTIKVIRE